MKGKASVLKIYISELDKIDSAQLFEEIVKEARGFGLAGATVYRGVLSFGASHSVQTDKAFYQPEHLPVIIEIVDAEGPIRKFAERVHELIDLSQKGALVTIHPVEVVEYKPGDKYNEFGSF